MKKLSHFCTVYSNLSYGVAGGIEVECDFGEVVKTQKVITRFHNIDYERFVSSAGTSYFSYSVETDVLRQILNGSCYQSVVQLCQRWLHPLYEIDKQFELQTNSSLAIHACHCLRYLQQVAANLMHQNDR